MSFWGSVDFLGIFSHFKWMKMSCGNVIAPSLQTLIVQTALPFPELLLYPHIDPLADLTPSRLEKPVDQLECAPRGMFLSRTWQL